MPKRALRESNSRRSGASSLEPSVPRTDDAPSTNSVDILQIEQIETNRDEGGEVILNSPPSKKKQGLQYKYWCFTWNNYHLDHQRRPLEQIEQIEIIDSFAEILKFECDWYVFQEEVGEKTGTPHLQGTICLKRRQRFTEVQQLEPRCAWFDTKAVRASVAYCSKQYTRKPDGRQWVHNIDIPKPLKIREPYGWQMQVMDIIKTEPDDREIHWFWEPTGGVGKSSLCKYLAVRHNALMLTGKTADMFHLIGKYPRKRELIVIDVPRSTQDFVNYGAIEAIKNGFVCSGKYDGAQLIFNYPHVICFANEPPKLTRMSENRWRIVQITV